MIYPKNFEEKIGFNIVREDIKKFCINDLSYDLVYALNFLSDFDLISRRLNYSNEMLHLLNEENSSIHLGKVDDFRHIFKSSNVDGTFMDVSTIFALKKSLNNLKDIVELFSNKDSEKYPLLKDFAGQIDYFPQIINAINKVLDKTGEVKDNATLELFKIRSSKRKLESSIARTLNKILQKAQQDDLVDRDSSPVIREGRLVIPVPFANKRKIDGIIHDESATGKTFYIEPSEVVILNNNIRELESEERKEIVKILVSLTSFIRPYFDEVLHSISIYLRLDVFNAIANYAITINAITPKFVDERVIDWHKARHPILEKKLKKQGSLVVPLDIEITDENRIVVISGANAGGKSVAIKTVGLLQYMVQCGLPIPVDESSRVGVFDSIFLDIGDEQSLENDLSTYSSHLQNIKFFIKNSTDHSLLIMDEFGSGTDPEIGGAIAEATLEIFNNKGVFGLITTHYANIKYFAEHTKGVVNAAMLYDRSRLKPLFILKTGESGSSFALEIAQNIGLPKELIDKAKDLVGSEAINYDKLTKSVVKNKLYWEKKRNKIRLQSKRQDELILEYEKKISELKTKQKEIIEDANIEAKNILDKANATVENTIRKIKESNAQKEQVKEAREDIKELSKSISIPKSNKTSTFQKDKLNVGDNVTLRGQKAVGEIVDISGKKATVVFGAIKTIVKLDELVYVSKNKIKKAKKANLSQSTINSLRGKQLRFSHELDIRGMRVNEAIQALIYYLDDAQMANVSRVRILHGTGEGALRQAVREYLSSYSGLKSFADEHVQLGGAGITVINF